MESRLIVTVGLLLTLIGTSSFAADGDLIVNGNVTISGGLTAPNVLTKYYQSDEQTITSGGPLTLPHLLPAEPVLIQVVLKCMTAEYGYSVGDKVIINPGLSKNGAFHQGVVVVPDDTNLNIRFGSQASYAFAGLRKDTGATVNFSNTKWKVIFRAWSY